MRRRKSLFGGSILDRLRWRFRDPGTDGVGGGPAADSPEIPDVAPVNGGPDRSFDSLSSGTIDDTSLGSSANPATTTAARTPADPNQAAGTAAAPQWQSIREAAQAQGFQFDGTVTDDRTALNFLLAQAGRNRQADVYAQLGRQLAPKSAEIQQFLHGQTRQQSERPAAPTRPAWEAPTFDERWMAGVERDPVSGLFVSKPGFPHEYAQKVNEYAEWKAQYDKNPAAILNGMVEARSRAIAEETFNKQFAAQQQQATIQSIAQENASFLYATDAAGQRVTDWQGKYVPSPIGAAYMEQLRLVYQLSPNADPRAADAMAKNLVRGQMALQAQQAAYAQQQQTANPQTAQAVNQPNRNPLQAQPPSTRRANAPAATDPDEKGLSLAERIRRDLAAEGITDTDVHNSAGV